MDNLVKDTLEKIKGQGIMPEPRWKYLAKKYAKWVLFSAILLLAGIAFSAGYSNINSLDWDLYRFANQNRVIYFLTLVPYFWLGLLAIFILAAFIEVRRTNFGYRYSRSRIFILTIGGFLLFATAGIFFGLGSKFNMSLSRNFPIHSHRLMMTKEMQWAQPEKGFLSGTIKSVDSEEISLEDFSGHDWNVTVSEKTIMHPSTDLSNNNQIKIIGTQKNANDFSATEIRPWAGRGMGQSMSGARHNEDGMQCMAEAGGRCEVAR